jgi:hypothetical protein
MKKLKPLKKHVEAHSSSAKLGMGDFYGSGVKNPVGKIRDVFTVNQPSMKKMGKPPKSLA